MKRINVGRCLLVLLCILPLFNSAQAFHRIVVPINVSGTYSVLQARQTGDGGYIIASGNGDPYGASVGFLLKLNAAGNTSWYQQYANLHSFNAVDETSDGGFIAAGKLTSAYPYDNVVMKTDNLGNITWARNISYSSQGGLTAIQQTSDGGYITAMIQAMKLDATGNVVWGRMHVAGGGNTNAIEQTSDGGYIGCGEGSYGTPANNYNAVLTKLNSAGVITWNRSFGEFEYDWGSDCHQTTDGGYIYTGWTRSWGNPNSHVFLIKTDGSGNITWSKVYAPAGQSAGSYAAIQTSDGGYAVTGNANNLIQLMKTDANGTLQWAKTYGSGTGYSVDQTTDGGYLVAGHYNGDLIVFKTDANGTSICDASASFTETTVTFLSAANSANTPLATTIAVLAPTATTSSPVFTSCVPLAITGIQLQAVRGADGVELHWTAAGMLDGGEWQIERQHGTGNWELITQLGIPGPKMDPQEVWMDAGAPSGELHYRVVYRDLDGREQASNTVALYSTDADAWRLQVFPQPLHSGDALQISVETGLPGMAQVEVLDLRGAIVVEKESPLAAGTNSIRLEPNPLSPGMYLIKCRFRGGQQVLRMIVQ